MKRIYCSVFSFSFLTRSAWIISLPAISIIARFRDVSVRDISGTEHGSSVKTCGGKVEHISAFSATCTTYFV